MIALFDKQFWIQCRNESWWLDFRGISIDWEDMEVCLRSYGLRCDLKNVNRDIHYALLARNLQRGGRKWWMVSILDLLGEIVKSLMNSISFDLNTWIMEFDYELNPWFYQQWTSHRFQGISRPQEMRRCVRVRYDFFVPADTWTRLNFSLIILDLTRIPLLSALG